MHPTNPTDFIKHQLASHFHLSPPSLDIITTDDTTWFCHFTLQNTHFLLLGSDYVDDPLTFARNFIKTHEIGAKTSPTAISVQILPPPPPPSSSSSYTPILSDTLVLTQIHNPSFQI